MLNNSGESGHPCLAPDLRGECFQFFNIENNVCCRLIIYGLYYVEVGYFYAHFFEEFKFEERSRSHRTGKVSFHSNPKESESEVTQSCLTLSDPMDYSPPGPLYIGLSRQEYWSGVPLPSLLTAARHIIFTWSCMSHSQIYTYPLPLSLPPIPLSHLGTAPL